MEDSVTATEDSFKTQFLALGLDSPQLIESAVLMAETFLVKCLKPSTDLEIFDDLRFAAFNSNALKMDFEKTLNLSKCQETHP